jgi:hypothetical protein
MLRKKGKAPGNWNWQTRDERPSEEHSEQQEYLTNVEKISHGQYEFNGQQEKSDEKDQQEEPSRQTSTRESSDKNNEVELENFLKGYGGSRYYLRNNSSHKKNYSEYY